MGNQKWFFSYESGSRPGNPLRWKQNNAVFKFSSQDYLVLARLRGLLGLRGILLKELLEKKIITFWHNMTKSSPVKSLLPFESPKVTTLHS